MRHLGNETISGIWSSGPGSTLDFSQEIIGVLHNLIYQTKLQTGRSKIRSVIIYVKF